MTSLDAFWSILQAIVAGDAATASRLLAASPNLASGSLDPGATRRAANDFYYEQINHYVYEGDTALHVAAAAYRHEIARKLIAAGARAAARDTRGRPRPRPLPTRRA